MSLGTTLKAPVSPHESQNPAVPQARRELITPLKDGEAEREGPIHLEPKLGAEFEGIYFRVLGSRIHLSFIYLRNVY